MEKEPLLIGIDGGATKVSAWEIVYDKLNCTFTLGSINSTKSYREIEGYISDFVPIDLPTQLKERDTEINTTAEENQQAEVYVEACAQAISALVKQKGNSSVLIGIGMPGLKTADKRGIAVVANGPRMIDYSNKLEKKLEALNIKLKSPISHLGSDADYCGIGENYSDEGTFRNCKNAYYLGGGTGVADAMKLDGQLVTFDAAREWMAKTWEMKSDEGLPLERVTSVSGIQLTYAEFSAQTVEALNTKQIYPLQIAKLAKEGDTAAIKTFDVVNMNLAKLLCERIVTLNKGWQNLFEFVNPNRTKLNVAHSYQGKVFDSIVIGQRLGDLFEDRKGKEIVKAPVLERLNHFIQNSEVLPENVKLHYKNLDKIIQVSKLREAPALGAGVDAFLSKTS